MIHAERFAEPNATIHAHAHGVRGQSRRAYAAVAMAAAAATSLLLSAMAEETAASDGGGGRRLAGEHAGGDAATNAPLARAPTHRRLPQHRVRTAKRRVPYPADHPLERRANADYGDSGGPFSSIMDGGADDDIQGTVVGGDGSRSSNRRSYRRRQQQLQQRKEENKSNRFLRFVKNRINQKKFPPSPHGGVAPKRRNKEEEPEAIHEGVVRDEGDAATTLRYWSISGRNLASSPPSGSFNSTKAVNDGQLLMDVERIYAENGEASSINGNNNPDSIIEGGDDQGNGGHGDADGFDIDQYYNYQGSSLDKKDDNATMIANEEDEKSSLYQPIRLRAVFTDDESSGSKYVTPSQRKILMEDMINPALFAWSQALHVVPVGGGSRGVGRRNERQDGDDNGDATTTAGDDGDDKLVVDKTQLYDGVTCGPGMDSGLPSVRVPSEHMTVGLADTDTVIYVSVAFADEHSQSTAASESTEDSSLSHAVYHLHRGATGPKFVGTARRQDNMNETATVWDENGTSAHPSVFPSYSPSPPPSEKEPYVETRPTCPGTYLASSTYCSSDQHDRPVAGILSLCISNVHGFFHDPEQLERNVVTIMHEIGHILGFNVQSLANFRDPDTGEPLTPRDGIGDVPDQRVECTGVSPRTESDVPLPSKDVLKFRSVRGGVRVATIVTPTVQRVARNMFGCRTLPGAELESGEGQMFGSDADALEDSSLSSGECIGDHWARRLFRTDLMNTIVDDVPYSLYISSLTLAYFADSGWYRVDTERITPPSKWGRNAGCDFVEKQCITSGGLVPASSNPFFCANFLEHLPEEEVTEIHGCDLDASRKAVCSLVEYDAPVPEPYDYFDDKELDHTHYYGGSDPTLDYCPVFTGFSDGLCSDEESKEAMLVRGSLEVFGEVNSRCVVGNVDRKRTALCLPIACVIQESSLMVKVDGYWKPCSYAGQIISVWWAPNDYVVCPDPSRMCPTFYCAKDCLDVGGICDYESGQCMCAVPNSSPSNANVTSWFTNNRSYQRFEPCSGEKGHFKAIDERSQTVERIDFALPEYYVENTTVLLDDPRNFDDKMSRMFSQLTSGEVFGLVTSFMMFVICSYLIWSQLVKCYARNVVGESISNVRSSVGSLPRLLRSFSHPSLENNDHHDRDDMDPPLSDGRPPESGNPTNKQKMVATLLVQLRTEGSAMAEQEQQRRLQMGGLRANENAPTIVDLSSPTNEEVLVNRSELPSLQEGRVLAVVGANIVEDEVVDNDDSRSTVTSATHLSSQTGFTSPLYQEDAGNRGNGSGRMMLRLRRNM